MNSKNYVRVVSHGNFREGVSAKGNPYIMGEAFVYVSDANNPYPQKVSYYCETRQHILTSGEWLVPVEHDVRDGRIDFRLNTEAAIPYVKDKAVQPTAKAS